MVAMRVVQVAVNQVVDMVAMRHGLVSATGAVYMAWLVAGAMVPRRAAVVLDRRVSTTGAVLVLVRLVVGTCAGR